ncbi:MAG TPA: hypothetical protein VGD67_26795 [Pseudonocardiaceae bacterium]
MTWRAHILPDPYAGGVRVALTRRLYRDPTVQVVLALDPAERAAGLSPRGTRTVEIPESERGPDPHELPLLDDDMARALLDALAAHYGGTGDTRQLREDYDAERGRVDRLIGALIDPNGTRTT